MNTKKIGLTILVIATVALSASAVSAQQGRPDRRPGRPPAQRLGARFQAGVQILMQAVVDETGLTPQEITQQVRAGSSLAEVITANGGIVDTVVANAVAAATERISEQVEAGNLPQERADEMIANLEITFSDAVNGELPGRPGGQQRPLVQGVLREAAEATGLEVSEITQQLRDGATLAEILSANGVDIETFVDGLIADAQARFDERLEALREQLLERLNTSPSAAGSSA